MKTLKNTHIFSNQSYRDSGVTDAEKDAQRYGGSKAVKKKDVTHEEIAPPRKVRISEPRQADDDIVHLGSDISPPPSSRSHSQSQSRSKSRSSMRSSAPESGSRSVTPPAELMATKQQQQTANSKPRTNTFSISEFKDSVVPDEDKVGYPLHDPEARRQVAETLTAGDTERIGRTGASVTNLQKRTAPPCPPTLLLDLPNEEAEDADTESDSRVDFAEEPVRMKRKRAMGHKDGMRTVMKIGHKIRENSDSVDTSPVPGQKDLAPSTFDRVPMDGDVIPMGGNWKGVVDGDTSEASDDDDDDDDHDDDDAHGTSEDTIHNVPCNVELQQENMQVKEKGTVISASTAEDDESLATARKKAGTSARSKPGTNVIEMNCNRDD